MVVGAKYSNLPRFIIFGDRRPIWRRIKMYRATLFLIFLVSSLSFSQESSTILRGDYLGQEPPGLTKKMFAPGVISTDAPEGCISFSHDGKYLVFRRHWREQTEIYILENKNDEWTRPEIAPFFMKPYRLGDFTFAPNVLQFYFTSDRPVRDGDGRNESSDIWMVESNDNSWLRPVHLRPPVNSTLHDSYPSVSNDKTIYFFRRFDGDDGLSEILSADFRDGVYSEPVNLGENINTEWDEWDPAISPNGNLLVFCSKKPSGMGKDDLYVSFKDEDDRWSESINIGDSVNTSGSENRPFITADGKYLFFNSDTNGSRDIFWIDMEIVRKLRPF